MKVQGGEEGFLISIHGIDDRPCFEEKGFLFLCHHSPAREEEGKERLQCVLDKTSRPIACPCLCPTRELKKGKKKPASHHLGKINIAMSHPVSPQLNRSPDFEVDGGGGGWVFPPSPHPPRRACRDDLSSARHLAAYPLLNWGWQHGLKSWREGRPKSHRSLSHSPYLPRGTH